MFVSFTVEVSENAECSFCPHAQQYLKLKDFPPFLLILLEKAFYEKLVII